MAKWKNAAGCVYTEANGYHAVVFLKGSSSAKSGAWFGINDITSGAKCIHTEPQGKTWSTKRAKRRAARYLFRLPKLN